MIAGINDRFNNINKHITKNQEIKSINDNVIEILPSINAGIEA
jgi:hypothetical protein